MKNSVLYLIIGLLVGAGVGVFAMQYTMQPQTMPHTNMMDSMEGAMQGMMHGLEGKRGAAFDSAFVEQMIVHHEGAIGMAQAALVHAEREEIKTMARAIIDAQSAEIETMRGWMKAWGSVQP